MWVIFAGFGTFVVGAGRLPGGTIQPEAGGSGPIRLGPATRRFFTRPIADFSHQSAFAALEIDRTVGRGYRTHRDKSKNDKYLKLAWTTV